MGDKKYDISFLNIGGGETFRCNMMEKALNVSDTTIVLDRARFLDPDMYHRRLNKRKQFEGKLENAKIVSKDKVQELFGNTYFENKLLTFSNNQENKIDIYKYGFENELEESITKKMKMIDDENILFPWKFLESKDDVLTETDLKINIWCWKDNCFDCIIRKTDRGRKWYLHFENVNEKENFINSLKTTFMDYWFVRYLEPNNCKLSNSMFMMKDYTKPWDDKRFCEYFGIYGFIDSKHGEPGSEWEYIVEKVNKRCIYE